MILSTKARAPKFHDKLTIAAYDLGIVHGLHRARAAIEAEIERAMRERHRVRLVDVEDFQDEARHDQ